MTQSSVAGLDALADAIAARLMNGRSFFRPGPDQLPQLPGIPGPEELPDLLPKTRIAIRGLELTQSIQHFETGYGADNSVPIVALKPLVVRAYAFVQHGLFSPDALTGQRVTGTLTLRRWNQEVFSTGPTRAEGAQLGAAADLQRTMWDQELSWSGGGSGGFAVDVRMHHINAPLNFLVPAWRLRAGQTTATVTLRTESGATASASVSFTVLDVPAPRIAVVRVNWTDAAGATTSPSDADMLDTLRMAERMLPFPYFETTILDAELTRSGAFAMVAASGGCNASWNALLTDLEVTRIFTALFQLGDIVFGFVPAAAIPAGAGTINSGCGRSSGVGGGFVGFQTSFAHEIGHIFDRDHVAVAGDASSDAAYPNYGGDRRSIGEVGLDIDGSAITTYDPDSSDDIMSYGANQWISPYTYRAILDARGTHQSAPADPRRVRPFLILDFRAVRLARGGEWSIETRAAHRIAAPGFVERVAEGASAISIDLIDVDDRIVATHHCFASRSLAGCGCCGGGAVPEGREPWLDFAEAIPWPEEADVKRIAFHRGGEPLAVLEVGAPPRFEFEGPRFVEDGLELVLRIAVDGPASAAILFSADDGETWTPVLQDPPRDAPFRIDPRRLRGGARCRFRAVVTANLASDQRDTEAFELPETGRALFVALEAAHCAPGAIRMRALVDARGLGGVAPQDVVWASDRDGELGHGLDLDARLSDGRHAITARIPDGIGGTLAETGIIIVSGRPR